MNLGAIPQYTPNLSYVAAPVAAPVGIPGATLEDVNAVARNSFNCPRHTFRSAGRCRA